MLSFAANLAAAPLDLARQHIEWIIAAAIVVVCLVVYGWRDLLRLSLVRIRAIASVSFRESIRRRVLWLTPLAIIAVLLVTQFQRPFDEQDAIRQVTKFCVFASGMLVTIAAVILACTNIPREIDNRVIYTVVTKPTTRIEILIGKIVGFAGISAAILIIMGLFTWGYLQVQEWRVLQTVQQRLQGDLEPPVEQTLRYYSRTGLLDARRYVYTYDIQVYPSYQAGKGELVIQGPGEQDALFPFVISEDMVPPGSELTGMALSVKVPYSLRPLKIDELTGVAQMADVVGLKITPPPIPTGPERETATIDVGNLYPAFFGLGIHARDQSVVADPMAISGELPLYTHDPSGQQEVRVPLNEQVASSAINQRLFYVRLTAVSPGTRIRVSPDSVKLIIALKGSEQPLVVSSKPFDPRIASPILIIGRNNQNGQQLGGDPSGNGAVGVIAFRDAPDTGTANAHFEIRTIVERGGDDPDEYATTWLQVQVANLADGTLSKPEKVAIESRRTAHVTFPSSALGNGNFDLLIRPLTEGQWISLRAAGVRLAGRESSFGSNLFKSYLILWMFSLLVITISIFCSTFLSWPIAVVLTLVILFGHWGVLQLGEMAAPGVGRQVVSDLFSGAAPAVTETLTRSFEGLGAMLRLVAAVLPDISQFAAMEDLEQGIVISAQRIGAGLKVLLIFGLSILALSYVIFRNKEVAP